MEAKLVDKAIHVRMEYSRTALPRLLLILIANFANAETRISTIPRNELSRLTGFPPETIKETLYNLSQNGYIEILEPKDSNISRFYLKFLGDDTNNLKDFNNTKELEQANITYTPRWMPHSLNFNFYQEDLDAISDVPYIQTSWLMMLPKCSYFSPCEYKDYEAILSGLHRLEAGLIAPYKFQKELIHNTVERFVGKMELTHLDLLYIATSCEIKNIKEYCLELLFDSSSELIIELLLECGDEITDTSKAKDQNLKQYALSRLLNRLNASI